MFRPIPSPTHGMTLTVPMEISSKCVGQYGAVNATDGHNIVMNSDKYVIQQEWSNALVACTLTPPLTSVVGIKFAASGLSSPISTTNFFTITYAIGNQLFVFNYVGKPVSINADPDTSVSIAPTSSRSNVLEKWCLNAACQGVVIPLSATPQNVTLGYHDFSYSMSLKLLQIQTRLPHSPRSHTPRPLHQCHPLSLPPTLR